MKLAKGYVGGRRKLYRMARETVERVCTTPAHADCAGFREAARPT